MRVLSYTLFCVVDLVNASKAITLLFTTSCGFFENGNRNKAKAKKKKMNTTIEAFSGQGKI